MNWKTPLHFLVKTGGTIFAFRAFAALGGPNTQGVPVLVKEVYYDALSIGGILAFAVIVWGAIRYTLAAGNPSAQSEGKEWIRSALLGLLLLLGVYLILNTISPNLTKLELPTLEPIKTPALPPPGVPGPGIGETPGGLSDQEARDQLAASGVNIKPGVSLEGVHDNVINEAVALKESCGCDVTITSGTEGSHATDDFTHENGYKIDIRPNAQLDSYITSNYTYVGIRSDGARMYADPATGAVYARELNHWDVLVR